MIRSTNGSRGISGLSYTAFDNSVYTTPEAHFGGIDNVAPGWLKAMIDAGIHRICLTSRRYPRPGGTSNFVQTVDELEIVGEKRPTRNAGDTALVNGSIIEGGLLFIDSSNISLRNLGIDGGDDYTGTNPNDGHAVFSRTTGILIEGVTILGKSASRALGAHSILIQGGSDYVIRDVDITYGFHGIALKTPRGQVERVNVRKAIAGFTLKSDTVAIAQQIGYSYRCADLRMRDILLENTGDATTGSAFGISIGTGSAIVDGQDISNVDISGVRVRWSAYNSSIPRSGIALGSQVDGGQIEALSVRGLTVENGTFPVDVQAINLALGTNVFDDIVINKASRGIIANGRIGSRPLTIGTIAMYACTNGISVDGYSDVAIGQLTMISGSANAVMMNGVNGKIRVGSYRSTTRPLFDSAVATIYSGTNADYTGDGTTPLRLTMAGGAFILRGKIAPGQAEAATDYAIFVLAAWARPASKRTISTPAIVAGAVQTVALDISPAGVVSVKSLPASTTYISVDGVSWEMGL